MKNYDDIALLFAEKYGIIDYKVVKNKMIYYEEFSESKYRAQVNLDTMKETRTQIK